MESSDDSFLRTEGSSDSEGESDTKSVRKVNNNDSDDVSESGKKYKKQLQKRLFEGRESPSGARVKSEPPSDADCAPPPDQPDSDDNYLKLLVKLERAAATHDTTNLSDSSVTHRSRKSKKKKRKRESDAPSDDYDYKITSSRIEDQTLDSASSTPRKKRFKGERCSGDVVSYEMIGMMAEDKFSAVKTVVKARPSSEGWRRPPVSNGTETDGRTERRISKVKPDGAFTSKEFMSDESDDDDEEDSRKSKTVLASRPARRSSTRDGEPLDDRALTPDVSHRKFSDRIQFEADDTSDDTIDVDTMDVDTSGTAGEGRGRSTKVSRYLSSRGHEHERAACQLTRDDEAWRLHCPSEVDVSALRGTNISLDEDAKCKIKVDAQTNNGSVEERDARINVLSVEHDRTEIVNMPVSGTVRFRKRIPKAHFVEDGKLSDRVQFEADDTADDTMNVDTSGTAGDGRVWSTKVSRYLSSRGHLRAPAHRHEHERAACQLTPDDEVWLLHCPSEMDVSALRGTNISLGEDAKCKIKVDGQTYNGSVEDRNARINVLSVEDDRTVIANIPVLGIVRFRKRIPKVHFVEDGHVLNDRTDFIPLPETKCRHPLFGTDYRRAVRVPTSIKDRLNRPYVEEPQVRKKRKHKKQRVDLEAPALEPEPEPAPEPAAEPRRSKKRKHKYSDADADAEEPTLKKKRVKREPSSAPGTRRRR